MGFHVAVGDRLPGIELGHTIIRWRLQHDHFRRRPFVALRQRQPMNLFHVAGSMAEPVMHHELQPRRGKNVQMRHLNEFAFFTRQQLQADHPRIGRVEIGRLLAIGFRDRYVAAEASAGHSHPRAPKIVVTSICGSLIAWCRFRCGLQHRRITFCTEHVVAPHVDAQADQRRYRQRIRQAIPDAHAAGDAGENPEKTFVGREWQDNVPRWMASACDIRFKSCPSVK